ncbi:MAG: DUF4399 domain-containing protein [Beijerinckiaceae bacterium]
MRFALLFATVLSMASLNEASAEPFWPAAAKVYFIAPAEGSAVSGPVTVIMGLSGLGIAPAGVDKPSTGHHHILVDGELPKGAALLEPMIADEHFRHFGGGQTQTSLVLVPGTHTLQLIVGDQNHIPYDPPLVSEKITITVK